MSALEARTNSGTGIHPRGRIHSDLYFHGSRTATSPEVTQPPSSEKHLYGGFARLLHQPIDTVTVMHSKRQLHHNWSRGVTSHSEVTKDTVEGYVLTKLVEWYLIWDIFTLEDTQQPSTKVHFEIVLMTLADFISETHFTEAQSFSSAKMKCPFQPLVVSLILLSVCGNNGQVGQLEKGGDGSESVDPQGGQVNSKNLSTPLLAADFHKENTVTNDWITEGEEDEDYLDLEKLFGEDDDYIDIIDVVSPTDSEASAGNILQLFHGKSRIQRLNILNAKFAFNLYRALREQASPSDNIFIAPVGISTAMGMLSLGLKGETHEQVHSILHFKDFVNASSKYEIMTIHNLFRKLTHRLFRRNFGYTLRSVNDLYIQKQFPILNDFKTKVKEYYFAEAQAADFSDPAFISKTNNHILKLTKGLIKDALENIDPATEMMILNCIYFKGSWVNKFPTEMTHNHNFRLNEREVVKVSMMQTKGSFLATNDQELDCDVLQLEYVGGISMLIVVPHKLSGMKTLETQLTPQVVERWQKSMTNRTREVLLPKFKLEKNYNLVEALKSMGITALFDKSSNMTGISDQRIAIDLFKHQGTITVNEEGTQAAAVTTVGFMPLTTQVRFNVDRPFLFLVYEHRTSCLLFMGKVANPTKS